MLNLLPPALRKKIVFYEPTGCWIWCGAVGSGGYGNAWDGSAHRYVSAHCKIFEWISGPVPTGLELDHICRIRQCCNPAHLEPVTRLENLRRAGALDRLRAFSKSRQERTHCGRGHELNSENLRIFNGKRHCMACRRETYAQRKRIAAGAV